MYDARATAHSSPSISSESFSRRVRTLRPSSMRRIFSSRVPNNDSIPRLICTLDFMRGVQNLTQAEGGESCETSAGAEAGDASITRIAEIGARSVGRQKWDPAAGKIGGLQFSIGS